MIYGYAHLIHEMLSYRKHGLAHDDAVFQVCFLFTIGNLRCYSFAAFSSFYCQQPLTDWRNENRNWSIFWRRSRKNILLMLKGTDYILKMRYKVSMGTFGCTVTAPHSLHHIQIF